MNLSCLLLLFVSLYALTLSTMAKHHGQGGHHNNSSSNNNAEINDSEGNDNNNENNDNDEVEIRKRVTNDDNDDNDDGDDDDDEAVDEVEIRKRVTNDDDDDSDDDDDDEAVDEVEIRKRIIGGKLAPENKYNWVVSLKGDIHKYKTSGFCGAAILNTGGRYSRWLISAAHCFIIANTNGNIDLTNPKYWHARIGLRKVDLNYKKHSKLNWFKNRFKSMSRKVKGWFGRKSKAGDDVHLKKIILHPKYTPYELEFDIAILKLKHKIDLKNLKNVESITLPPLDIGTSWPKPGDICLVVGWGCTAAGGNPNNVAKVAELKIWSNDNCREAFKAEIGLNEKHEFCAGYLEKNYGLCPGDSGSALACHYKGQYRIAGVVSAAHVKRPGQFPALFTRVSYFHRWITTTIDNN